MKTSVRRFVAPMMVLTVSSALAMPQAFAAGHGCGQIAYHNNEAKVTCFNNSNRSVTATLNVDCQPWSPDKKTVESIPPHKTKTLVAKCSTWGKAVGGSASTNPF